MHGGNGRLGLEWTRRTHSERAFEKLGRAMDGLMVPARSVLLGQRYGMAAIVESRVFDIGGGFVMDDHVMEKPL